MECLELVLSNIERVHEMSILSGSGSEWLALEVLVPGLALVLCSPVSSVSPWVWEWDQRLEDDVHQLRTRG